MTPGAVIEPAGASSSSESAGLSFAASTSIAGFAARWARLIEREHEGDEDAGDRRR